MIGRIVAIARAVVADMVRRKVFYVVIFFAALMVLAIPSLPTYGVGVVRAVYREVSLALTFTASLVLTVAVASTRLPVEIERRTVYHILTRSVRRWEYLGGTWLGIFLTVGVAIASFTLVQQLAGFAVYGDPMWRLWQGAFAILLEMGVLAAFALAFTTVSGSVASVVATLTFLFLGHSRAGLLGDGGASILKTLYPSLDAFNVTNSVAHGSGISAGYALSMVLVFVGYSGVLLLAGALGLSRKDL